MHLLKLIKQFPKKPANFSFKNSQAIIMFESNKETASPDAIYYMHKAMGILKSCYLDDKRKLYHAQKFAEFSLYFYTKYKCTDYLLEAKNWLNEVSMTSDYTSRHTGKLIEQLTSILSHETI